MGMKAEDFIAYRYDRSEDKEQKMIDKYNSDLIKLGKEPTVNKHNIYMYMFIDCLEIISQKCE